MKISKSKEELKRLIKEEMVRMSKKPSVELTNQLVREINEKLASLPSGISTFLNESRNKNTRRIYRDDLEIVNQKLDEIVAFLESDNG